MTIKDLITSKAARQILLSQKHSPKILFTVGVVGVVGATVLACRATLKVSDVLDEHEKAMVEAENFSSFAKVSQTEAERSISKLKIKTTLEIAKLYAPAVGVGVLSVAALTGSHIVLSKRNAGVMAAYAAMDRAYKEYRQRVSQELGEDKDREFALGGRNVAVEEKRADGSTSTSVKKVAGGKPNGSPYAVLFDESSKKFTREPGMNAAIIGMQQSWANDKLRANGHVFLNEVFDMLGLPRTKAGAVAGWVWRRDNEEKTGDNYVSFGVFDGDLERAEAFVDGDESSIWLDFNVDGVILDLI